MICRWRKGFKSIESLDLILFRSQWRTNSLLTWQRMATSIVSTTTDKWCNTFAL